jgi:hypothetical protein
MNWRVQLQKGANMPSPYPHSLIAALTNAETPARTLPLTAREAIVLLSHVYTRMLYTASIDPGDALARLAAEADLLRLRKEIHLQVFGIEI